MSDFIKITGPMFVVNSSNLPSTIPTNAPVSGANNDPGGGGTFSGYGNATSGGATMMIIVNNSAATVNVGVTHANSVNVGMVAILSNTSITLEKSPYQTVNCSATSGIFITPIRRQGA